MESIKVLEKYMDDHTNDPAFWELVRQALENEGISEAALDNFAMQNTSMHRLSGSEGWTKDRSMRLIGEFPAHVYAEIRAKVDKRYPAHLYSREKRDKYFNEIVASEYSKLQIPTKL